jgi:GntR family transcriptional regulator
MFFSIDPNNGIAIYEQIVRQVKFAIADGTLRVGQLLPSVRTLSQQLTINPNTIARAFQQLQTEGVVETLRGRGLMVAELAEEQCKHARRSIVSDRLRSALSEAIHAGLNERAIRTLVNEQLAELIPSLATVSTPPEDLE